MISERRALILLGVAVFAGAATQRITGLGFALLPNLALAQVAIAIGRAGRRSRVSAVVGPSRRRGQGALGGDDAGLLVGASAAVIKGLTTG